MAANLSNIAFFDISEDQFTGIKPLEFTLDLGGGSDYTDEELDEFSETYGEAFKSFANFAIQIDVDKKITLGHLGEYILQSESLWKLATKKGTLYPQWYKDLQNAINSTKNVIGSTSSTTRYWTWSRLINGYGGLIPLIEEISSLLGSISLESDTSDTVYRSWSDWKEEYSSITGWIKDNSEYLDKILGTDWTSYDEFNSLPVRLTRLENFTGVPAGGSALPPKSLSQQIEDINTALGKKSDKAGTDTVYGRLNQLESEVLFEDQIFNFDLSQAYKHVYNLGGSEVPSFGIIGDTPITKEILVLEKNHRYLLNNTSEILSFNNLVSSVRGLTAGKICYGIPSRNEAPIPRCEFKNLQDGDIVIIDSGDYYYLAGFYYMNSKFISQGYQGMCFPSITRTDTYSGQSCGLDFLSLALSLASVSPSSIYPWTLNGAPLDLTKTHFKDNMITSGTQLTFYKFSQDSEKVYSDWVNLAFPYTITIKAKDLNGDLHYFIDLNYKIGPLMQHVFDSNPKPN